MTKIHVIADLHWGAPKQSHLTPEEIVEFDKECKLKGEEVFLIGDNFDFKNTLKKDIPKLHLQYAKVKKQFGNRMVEGNHTGSMPDFVQYSSNITKFHNTCTVEFIHGHRVYWTDKKCDKWENKEFKGIGKFKFAQMRIVNWLDEKFWRKNIKESKKLSNLLCTYVMKNYAFPSNRPNLVLMGHKHGDNIFKTKFMGIEWFILPRGLTTLEV